MVTEAVNSTRYSDPENIRDVLRQGSVLTSEFSKIFWVTEVVWFITCGYSNPYSVHRTM